MTFRGTIRNGKVELERGADLPDGTVVRVQPVRTPKAKGSVYRLYDLAATDSLPADYAKELDHYLYGAPKRSRRSSPTATKASKPRRRPAAKPGKRRRSR